jgi:signal transduction histidine kinase
VNETATGGQIMNESDAPKGRLRGRASRDAGSGEGATDGGAPAPQAASAESIARAKWQWEGTADALRDIVCLLNAAGQIVRANRTVEHWGLGSVGDSLGLTPHELLHPGCPGTRCELAHSIETAWKGFDGEALEFEHRGVGARTVWSLSLRPLGAAPDDRALGDTRAVLIVSDVSELHRARTELERLNVSLESRVRARTRELADANRDLRNEVARREAAEHAQRNSMEELARLSGDLISAQENERRRISVELHDSVGQSLTGVKYSIERAMEMLRRHEGGNPLPVMQLALDGVRQAAASIREIAMNLRPSILDDMGASSAVAWSCRQFAEVYPDIRVVTELAASDGDIPDRLGTAVFRSTEELLNNVAKHAQATEVRIGLRRDSRHVWLEVRDNGIGIPDGLRDATRLAGHGIRNLRERAEMTGGRFRIGRGAAGGAVASICWHLMRDEVAGKEAST